MAGKVRVTGSRIDDPNYWLARAQSARLAAGQMVDAAARRTMIGISRSYEELARRTAARIAAATTKRNNRSPTRGD